MTPLAPYMPSFMDELEGIEKDAGLKDFVKKVPQLGKSLGESANKKYLSLHSQYPRVMRHVHDALHDPDTMVSIVNGATKLMGGH